MLVLFLLVVGVGMCLLVLQLQGLLELLVREVRGWDLPVQLVFLVTFDVQEEEQELWVAQEKVDTGDHPAEDQGSLTLIVAVIVEESSLVV